MTEHHVVFFSGGISSWVLAKRVAAKYGTDNLKLLFTDTMIEDEDLYRFLKEASQNVGGELVWIKEGRTPWEVFKDVKFLGNSRLDPCSRVLKREPAKKWIHTNYPDPTSVRLWLGMNWDEEHRLIRSQKFWEPYQVDSLLMEPPMLFQTQLLELLDEEGIEAPRLYKLGFPHNNCGGGCVKAGHAHFRHLLEKIPEVYAEWEANEKDMQEFLGRDVTILKDRTGGTTKPLSLKQLRERNSSEYDLFDWGGCGCFAISAEEEEEE